MTGYASLERTFVASAVDLFRFSATTWNAHRIHYDQQHAGDEGLPGIVVQAHLHGAWFASVARELAGPGARLRRLEWTNRRPVVADQPVRITGTVVAQGHSGEVLVELEERTDDGDVAATATGAAVGYIPGRSPWSR
jgi:hydroxyacyl-ACP dehydratase HTD2-like protein with hotdog domain